MRTLMFLLFTISFIPANAQNIGLYSNKESGRVQFAVSEIEQALKIKKIGFAVFSNSETMKMKADQNNIILITLNEKGAAGIIKKAGIKNAAELKSEGFIIHKAGADNKAIYVLGYDEAGTMYGGLEVAEIIKVNGIDAVQNQLQNPYMKVRGTKYNIPLDMRSPTYTEPSDAAQNNIAEMWNFDFWKEYIDNLARYRYNLISLWNMHPFPSMVKVPEYPDIALSDVRKSTGDWKENYSLNGWGFDAPEIMKSYEVLKKMTIEEKIDFWRRVMAYGKQRNVRFYVVTWNIFIYGIDGKYGITDKPDNTVTTDYFRKSIKQMVLTYPDLAGIGLTTGENMYDYTATQKEEWAFATYGQGVLDALKEQPGRKIDFIHRQHQTQAKEITSIFKDVMKNENINFVFSFKYAQAHVYSSVNQVFHQEFVKDIQGEGLKTLWTLRNDDNFYFRWGAPDFVRDFIKNIPYDVSEGFYYGSDQYVWGREFLDKYADGPRELEIVKHWYQWMCWGRLGYNPNMGNDRFVGLIQSRFPSVNAQEMFDAWQSASMIYPMVTGFHWGALDFQWYIESGQSTPNIANTPSGYHDVNRFITLPPHKGTGYISIPGYTKAFVSGSKIEGETPLQVADKIIQYSERALEWADAQSQEMNKELRITIDDIKTMARLGKNYGHKIRGATYLSLFRETLQRDWYNKAIEELNTSAGYWRHYAASGLANYYNPLWTNRVGYVDWRENFNWSLFDVIANGAEPNLPSMQPTAGGTILEAEAADFQISGLKTEVTGFTGTGYLETKVGDARHQVKWSYNAPESGSYILEFRYTLKREQIFLSPVEINGKRALDIEFWNTGNTGNWVWERVTVKLEKGENSISISPEGFVLLDHLNIIKNFSTAPETDLVSKWDTIRPLINPDKGWYHHMLDNGINKYLIQDEKELTGFPGMDHLYLRLAWAYLEPEEGKFDWLYIDDIVNKYVPMGYKISFRISCKETGNAPGSVPKEINGIRYATPYWVVQAGAKGIERPEFGSASWTPDWDDPVYLEKLDNFHKAFAEKYDGKPWVRYIDVGSIGDWGEGHTWSSTRIPPTFQEVKTHINLYLKHYKKTQLIVTDDLLASTKVDSEKQELLAYSLENGFSLRDDSPMVQGYMQNELSTWTVRHPEFFAEVYKIRPTVFELEHYGKVKSNGYWPGKNGAGIIPEYKVSGADVFRNAVKIIRPTYVGFHGYLGEWLTDNPEFTKEILNMCGYWYFPKSINFIQYKKGELTFEMEWLNKGVAPAYASYQLRGKLIPVNDASGSIEFQINDSGNKNWMPGKASTEKYTVTLSGKPKGDYWLAIQLFDTRSEKPVEIGIAENFKNNGYFLIQKITF